jgi:hypothetical protein
VITDKKFQADVLENCKTDIAITGSTGDTLRIKVQSGTLSIRNGKFAVWCYGAKHTWISTVSYSGHTFSSDADEPLQFVVDKDKGYVHVAGKGTVTLPDGTVVELSAAGSSAPSAETMPLTATRVPPTRTATRRPTGTPAPTRTPEIPEGMGAFVVINWYGQTMKVTINNQIYDVGANGASTTILLPPGHYTYSANWEDRGYYQGAVDIKLRGKFTMTFRE